MQGCIELLDDYKEAQGDGIPTTDYMMIAMAAIEKDIQQLKLDAEEDVKHLTMSAIRFEDGEVQQLTWYGSTRSQYTGNRAYRR